MDSLDDHEWEGLSSMTEWSFAGDSSAVQNAGRIGLELRSSLHELLNPDDVGPNDSASQVGGQELEDLSRDYETNQQVKRSSRTAERMQHSVCVGIMCTQCKHCLL